jgi:hypothetical protein
MHYVNVRRLPSRAALRDNDRHSMNEFAEQEFSLKLSSALAAIDAVLKERLIRSEDVSAKNEIRAINAAVADAAHVD